MSQPIIENKTRFALQPLFLANAEGAPICAVVIKATYCLSVGAKLAVSEKQVPVNTNGEYWGEPGKSSYKYEPEVAPFKTATDAVLIGHAYAPHAGAKEVLVSLRLGTLSKTVRVIGDRVWTKTFGMKRSTAPSPFERMP